MVDQLLVALNELRSEELLKSDVEQCSAEHRACAIRFVSEIPPALLRAALAELSAHADPMDDLAEVQRDLAQVAQTVPLRKAPAPQVAAPRLRVIHDLNEESPQPDPYLLLLRRFAQAVATSDTPLSILQWAAEDPAGDILRPPAPTAVRPSVWLMFAVCALDGRSHRIDGKPLRFQVEELVNPPDAGCRFSHTFRDARVRIAT